MSVATITSKGQVTIPKEVREKLGLRAGDQLDFQVEPDGGLRATPVSRKVDQVFGMLSSKSRSGKALSSADIAEGLRRALAKRVPGESP
jgi:antitoxin PrlF